MLKLFTVGLLASTFGFVGVESAQACSGSCGAAQARAATSCTSSGCTAASCALPGAAMDHGDRAVPPAPAAPQANTGVRRSYSYEPATPIYQYQAPSRTRQPGYSFQKTDPRRYNGGY